MKTIVMSVIIAKGDLRLLLCKKRLALTNGTDICIRIAPGLGVARMFWKHEKKTGVILETINIDELPDPTFEELTLDVVRNYMLGNGWELT